LLAQSEPKLLGTWVINVERSHFIDDPPKSYRRTYTLTSQGLVKAAYEVVYKDGTTASMSYTASFTDGKDYRFVGSRFGDTISMTSRDPRTTDKVVKKSGVITLTERSVVSTDGRTLTVTMLRPGATEAVIEVFDKQ